MHRDIAQVVFSAFCSKVGPTLAVDMLSPEGHREKKSLRPQLDGVVEAGHFVGLAIHSRRPVYPKNQERNRLTLEEEFLFAAPHAGRGNVHNMPLSLG